MEQPTFENYNNLVKSCNVITNLYDLCTYYSP